MRRHFALGFLIVLTLPACGGSSSPTTPTPTPTPVPTLAVVVATVTPTPVLAVPIRQRPTFCPPNPDWQFVAAWTTTVRETAGLSGNVNYINVIARNALGFDLFPAPINFDVNYVIRKAGTNHVNGGGQITLTDMGMCYFLTTGLSSLHVVQVVNFTDDRGNVMNIQTEFDIL
jgi:hypothetical protein